MTVTANQLRTDFPEFANVTSYPDAVVNFWLVVAAKMVNAPRWGNMADVGVELFTAHNLVLEFQAQAASANGAAPGAATGPVSGKTVDKVSVNYDTGASSELNAGHWNMTTYGTRFIRFAKLFGAGPIQVGAGCGFNDPLSSANAWGGPNTMPGWFGS